MTDMPSLTGPFEAQQQDGGDYRLFNLGSDGLGIALPFTPAIATIGNYPGNDRIAAMLANAPRLLAAIEGLIENAQPCNWDDDDDPDQAEAWREAFRAMCAARRLNDPFPQPIGAAS